MTQRIAVNQPSTTQGENIMNDVIETYDSNEARSDAERLREAKCAVDAACGDLVDAQAALTDLLDEVRQRLAATTAVRHPVFDLDYPDVDEAEDCARTAADDPSQESVDALADAMDDAATELEELNRDAQDTARRVASKLQAKPKPASRNKPRSGRKTTVADVDRIWPERKHKS